MVAGPGAPVAAVETSDRHDRRSPPGRCLRALETWVAGPASVRRVRGPSTEGKRHQSECAQGIFTCDSAFHVERLISVPTLFHVEPEVAGPPDQGGSRSQPRCRSLRREQLIKTW